MLLQPRHIKPDEKWDTTLNRGRGGLTFCWNSKVLWHLSQDFWNWLYVCFYGQFSILFSSSSFKYYVSAKGNRILYIILIRAWIFLQHYGHLRYFLHAGNSGISSHGVKQLTLIDWDYRETVCFVEPRRKCFPRRSRENKKMNGKLTDNKSKCPSRDFHVIRSRPMRCKKTCDTWYIIIQLWHLVYNNPTWPLTNGVYYSSLSSFSGCSSQWRP
jgi:hypothetical protein